MGRASILDSLNDDEGDSLDLTRFQPKAGPDKDALPAEQVRAIAEASNFPSREPKPRRAPPAAAAAPKPAPTRRLPLNERQPRRRRTGRTVQFNVRTTTETVEGFYAIADAQGWLLGETAEHALAALQRELAGKG